MTKCETTKSRFKIGDEVRYRSRIIDEWKYGIVTKYPNPTMKHHSDENNIWAAWHRKGEKPPSHLTYVPYDRDIIELVKAAPTTFEVGKKYRIKGGKTTFTVEYILSNGHAAGVALTGGSNILKNFQNYVEVIPPPPEEWRALFYRKNGKPEVSANYFPTKEDADYCWNGMTDYMYAIRTDINAKKEN
jgi:hypothetical protein